VLEDHLTDRRLERPVIESSSNLETAFSHSSGIDLKLAPVSENRAGYPTSQLQKGLVMIASGEELAEEAVGFGVPVVKLGLKAIFPGAMQLAGWVEDQEFRVVYRMNLEERLTRRNQAIIGSQPLYRVKEYLEEAYRRYPATRRWLTALSDGLRRGFDWQSGFTEAGWDYPVGVSYKFDRQTGLISVDIDASALPQEAVSEVVVMNEQGANYFDTYADSNGVYLQGEAIGSWELVTAERASFISRLCGVAFTLPQIERARLFRGRELVGSRLAWAGFGYSFSPPLRYMSYPLHIERLP
jgi:hypothetical protein